MTIAVVWQEGEHLWCAADTRLVSGPKDTPTAEIGSKIYRIPVSVSAMYPDGLVRAPHYWTEYGFVYAGAALPAAMTAATASTLLQKLAREGGRGNPPRFEEISNLVHRLAKRFMDDRRRFNAEGLFSAAFFGWCPHEDKYKVARIEGRDDADAFRVEISYPPAPQSNGSPWVVLGSGTPLFNRIIAGLDQTQDQLPRRAVEKMVADGSDKTVGGATTIGAAGKNGFDLFFSLETPTPSDTHQRRVFNGLDLDYEIGTVGEYLITINSTT